MSSSDVNANLIATLNNASNIINRYLPIFIYAFGIIGNSLNVLVLTHRSLRSNPSAIFFVATSIAGLVVILSGLTSRMMSGFAVDLTLTVEWISTIDRWLSSSVQVHLRQMSTLKNVWRSILAVLLYTCIINAPIGYCYEANLTGTLRGCYGSTITCRLTTDLIYAFGTTLLPLLLMIIFGLLIIRNVRAVQSRIQPVTAVVLTLDNKNTTSNTNGQQKSKKKDRQLLKMLFVQVILLFLFTCPHAIQKVYSSFAASVPPQTLQSAIQTLIFNILSLLSFIGSGMPFYIYTLSGGSIFRNALLNIMKTIGQKILCC